MVVCPPPWLLPRIGGGQYFFRGAAPAAGLRINPACMAFMANLPFVLSAGMGLNAYMAYTVCAGYGYSWHVALLAVFAEGLIFIVLSLTNVREAIFNAIPLTLKRGVSVGIGLFIAFIGLQNAGLSVDSSTLVTIISFPENFHTAGICALLALIGLFIMAVLYTYRVKGAILYGILGTWILGMLCQVTGIYTPDVENGFYTLFPTLGITDFSKLGETFGKCFTFAQNRISRTHGKAANLISHGSVLMYLSSLLSYSHSCL